VSKKIKIFTISDHPLFPSGVATQTKNMIEGLLKTGKYKVVSFAGAIKHQDLSPIKTEEYGDDWVIYPVNGFGDHNMVRSILRSEKPDILWFMTDPRFYEWLWSISNEIRPLVPMVYYHVWDNYPYPVYNKALYGSNDVIATISKLTDDVVRNVSPETECHYIPHAVNTDVFKPMEESEILKAREASFKNSDEDTLLFFWNSRNARRKQPGAIVWWFKEFLERMGKTNDNGKLKAQLLMHTNPKDPNGPDLEAIVKELGLTNGEVLFSTATASQEQLNLMYNMSDVTLSASDAEGFGLSTLESLACGTPIIVPRTGGLQDQARDKNMEFGVVIEPAAKYIIGSQEVPFIYEDKVSGEDFKGAMYKMWMLTRSQRREIGLKGREHVLKTFDLKDYVKKWDDTLTKIHEEKGSWETRKGYERWTLKEITPGGTK
jgi:glycosyltransferase involved in cell wall biosynthesis